MSTDIQILYFEDEKVYRVRMADSTGTVVQSRKTFTSFPAAERWIDEEIRKIERKKWASLD